MQSPVGSTLALATQFHDVNSVSPKPMLSRRAICGIVLLCSGCLPQAATSTITIGAKSGGTSKRELTTLDDIGKSLGFLRVPFLRNGVSSEWFEDNDRCVSLLERRHPFVLGLEISLEKAPGDLRVTFAERGIRFSEAGLSVLEQLIEAVKAQFGDRLVEVSTMEKVR